MTLCSSLTPQQHAMLGHIDALRSSVFSGGSASKQLECAILLIDLYEAILERNGILIYEDQEKVVEH
mgnify:FL=1|tara:strand:- start:296 stop:496 length:201 start_codon:yes stop_codon:yes gene_type:complete